MTTETNSATATAPTSFAWVDGDLVLERVFRAPRERVFRAWTEPEHFARWFGPQGSSLSLCRMDVRPGGTLHFRHRFPDHEDVWVRGEYREVAAPERLSFSCHFSDPEGGRVERPGFPAEMTITVTFAAVPEGTRLTVRQTGLVMDQGEVQGWTEGMDRLAELLAAA
jgi:uncharacterized protein YndB with AHSA1/START domain